MYINEPRNGRNVAKICRDTRKMTFIQKKPELTKAKLTKAKLTKAKLTNKQVDE